MIMIASDNLKSNNINISDECDFDEIALYQYQEISPKDKEKIEERLETFLRLDESNISLNEKNKELEVFSDIEEKENGEGLFLINRNLLFFFYHKIEKKLVEQSTDRYPLVEKNRSHEVGDSSEIKHIIMDEIFLNEKNKTNKESKPIVFSNIGLFQHNLSNKNINDRGLLFLNVKTYLANRKTEIKDIKDDNQKQIETSNVHDNEIKNTYTVDSDNNTYSVPLSEKVAFVQYPQIDAKSVSKLPLEVPFWRVLHATQLTEKNNITYVFKHWGNERHQIKIHFFMEQQMQLIASTGRVYQTSLDNLNQYQGRGTLSFENNSKNGHGYISSIDADPKKEEGDL